MPDYAIIIPAFDEEAYLGDTLRAAREVMAALGRPGELVVVDNNSSDGTAAVARDGGADRVVFEPHNQIARARNAGADATAAERLVFVDADTRLNAETLGEALSMLDTGNVVGGGARIVMDQPVGRAVALLLGAWNRIASSGGYAAGSFFFCRRDAFEEVGGFDEAVYAGEEVWLARRLKRWARGRGMRFRFIADPPVVTSGRKSAWFSGKDFALQLAILFLVPWATRSRRLCRVWYRRPASAGGNQ